MAWTTFNVSNATDLLRAVVGYITDNANFTDDLQWELLSPTAVTDINLNTPCILKGKGDGEDEIYVGTGITNDGIIFNGYAGYDPGLGWEEQPGCIYHATYPMMPVLNANTIDCWVFVNSYRFIIISKIGTQFDGAYIGFIKAVSVERQYPYPLLIAGSNTNASADTWVDSSSRHSMFTNPGGSGEDTPMRLKRPDGVWEAGTNTANQSSGTLMVWPTVQKPTQMRGVMDTADTVANLPLLPMLLYEGGESATQHVGIIGEFDGVYWACNRDDIAALDTLKQGTDRYIIFSNINTRYDYDYFAIKLE